MSDSNRLKVSEMDFDTIKADLKSFMKEQSTFEDYNFEGSALSSMLDVMSYVTHYNAVNANFAINETFLDSSRLRPAQLYRMLKCLDILLVLLIQPLLILLLK